MTGVERNLPEVDAFLGPRIDAGMDVRPTHGRFSLRRGRDYIISERPFRGTEHGIRERVLIAPNDEDEANLYQQLAQAGFSQFEATFVDDNSRVYSIPIQAKPLAYESLHTGRASSETYVNDTELVASATSMWKRFNLHTGRMPIRKPLRNVALVDFDRSNAIPTPPYSLYSHSGYVKEPDQYLDMLKAELQNMGETDSIPVLMSAARHAWSAPNELAS